MVMLCIKNPNPLVSWVLKKDEQKKDRKTKTEVERCYKKNHEKGVRIEEVKNRRSWGMKTRCADAK